MAISGQLKPGLVEVIRPGTGENIGFAYTVENEHGQLQRWFLTQDPGDAFEIKAPLPKLDGMAFSDWQAFVNQGWTSESIYVRAQADVYRHGDGSNGTWIQIPQANDLPTPTYPAHGPCNFQLDHKPLAYKVMQQQIAGLAYSLGGVHDEYNVEYWLLPANLQPAGASASLTVNTGSIAVKSLQEFVDKANEQFGAGSVFIIVGCINYKGTAVPAML